MHTDNNPTCAMTRDCAAPVSMIDDKGYVYCEVHGLSRRATHRCRKLRAHELTRILRGSPLARY